jgi:hypothetical protein
MRSDSILRKRGSRPELTMEGNIGGGEGIHQMREVVALAARVPGGGSSGAQPMEVVLGWQASWRALAGVELGFAMPKRERGRECVKERASVGKA